MTDTVSPTPWQAADIVRYPKVRRNMNTSSKQPKEINVKRPKKPTVRIEVQYAELLRLREEVRKLASFPPHRDGQRRRLPRPSTL